MKQKLLKNLVRTVLESFVSRNNDLDGYWALGKLRSLADREGSAEVQLDLVNGLASPALEPAIRVAGVYRRFLGHQLLVRRLRPESLSSASVTLSFNVDETRMHGFPSYGGPFRCRVAFVDRCGHACAEEMVARCSPHDPATEQQSTRAGQ